MGAWDFFPLWVILVGFAKMRVVDRLHAMIGKKN